MFNYYLHTHGTFLSTLWHFNNFYLFCWPSLDFIGPSFMVQDNVIINICRSDCSTKRVHDCAGTVSHSGHTQVTAGSDDGSWWRTVANENTFTIENEQNLIGTFYALLNYFLQLSSDINAIIKIKLKLKYLFWKCQFCFFVNGSSLMK